MFFHGRANQFGQQRLRQQTCFGVIRCRGSDWTAFAVDEVLAIFFLESGRATQLFENAERSINSLPSSFAAQLGQMFVGHSSSCGAHSCAQISWLNLAREYRHEKRDQSPVCVRKKLFGVGAESICDVGLSKAGLHARMDDEPVTLQAGKVCSHSVVGQAQLFCEFVYRPISCSQKLKDFPSRAFEQPLPPAYMFH